MYYPIRTSSLGQIDLLRSQLLFPKADDKLSHLSVLLLIALGVSL